MVDFYKELSVDPYPGLRPFRPHENKIFMYQDTAVDEMMKILLHERRFLFVTGASGSGKSSLLCAGLLHQFSPDCLGRMLNAEKASWRVALLRPGSRPLEALATALLAEQALPELNREGWSENVLKRLREGYPGLLALLAMVETAIGNAATGFTINLLIVVDQFEEIFTYGSGGVNIDDDCKCFIELLHDAKEVEGVHVAFAMCERYIEDGGDIVRKILEKSTRYEVCVNHENILPAINVLKFKEFGGGIDSEIAIEILSSISGDQDALPILQHAMAYCWRMVNKTGSRNINRNALQSMGLHSIEDVKGLLCRHAEDVYGVLSSPQQQIAEIIFRAITEISLTDMALMRRCPQSLESIGQWSGRCDQDIREVVNFFSAPEVQFLQCHKGRGGQDFIDLSYDMLMKKWPRLNAWIINEGERAKGFIFVAEREKFARQSCGNQRQNQYAVSTVHNWSDGTDPFAYVDDSLGNVVDLHENNEISAKLFAAAAYSESVLLSGDDLQIALAWWNPGDEQNGWQPSTGWAGRYGQVCQSDLDQIREYLVQSREKAKREDAIRREDFRIIYESERSAREFLKKLGLWLGCKYNGLLTGEDLRRALEWWDPDQENGRWHPDAQWVKVSIQDLYREEIDTEDAEAALQKIRMYLVQSRAYGMTSESTGREFSMQSGNAFTGWLKSRSAWINRKTRGIVLVCGLAVVTLAIVAVIRFFGTTPIVKAVQAVNLTHAPNASFRDALKDGSLGPEMINVQKGQVQDGIVGRLRYGGGIG